MSLIIYSTDNDKNKFGVKQIDNSLFKKLMYNEIHKICKFSVPIDNIIKEFGLEYSNLINTNKNSECISNNLNCDMNSNPNINVLYMGELSQSQLKTYLEIYEDNEKDALSKFIEFILILSYNQINPDRFNVKKKIQ